MESEMEVCSEAVNIKEAIVDHNISFNGEKMKCLHKRPGQAWEHNLRKVPKLNSLHLSPHSSTCEPQIFPVSTLNSEINDVLSVTHMQSHGTLQASTSQEKEECSTRSESEMKKLVAQKIAIGM